MQSLYHGLAMEVDNAQRLSSMAAPTAVPGGRNSVPNQPAAPRSPGIQRAVRDRALPPKKDIDSANIEETYIRFILYCNPFVPVDRDDTELRKGFRSMPRADGKTFDTFTLFELIKKFEAKEIETWAQLVIDMGVEPPDPAKNQSTQKVQQYAVRLKRWLHAYHIDAFFQYCLGKPHSYYTDIPAGEPSSDTIRDGVSSEEDLALRALVPGWRPKRGRRKADTLDSSVATVPKRVQRASSLTAEETQNSALPLSSHPQTAFPWEPVSQLPDAWPTAQRPAQARSLAQPRAGPVAAQRFWTDLHAAENTLSTPYPQSAVTPVNRSSAFPSSSEARSAHPPSTPRSRKPAVSSAWPTSLPAAKLRGRRSVERFVPDGHFSTFSVQKLKETASTPVTPQSPRLVQRQGSKPGKLSLHVPPHAGGPVRLATPPAPPPQVKINGEADDGTDTARGARQSAESSDDFGDEVEEEVEESEFDESRGIDWKKRAFVLKKRLKEKDEELRALRRRVMEAVM